MRDQENLRTLSSSGDGPTAEGINGSGDPAEFLLTCRLCAKNLERIRPLLDGVGCRYSVARLLKSVPDEVQPLFRFELFFDGAYQGIGFLQKLDDTCEPDTYRRLMKPFKDDLPVPMGLDQPCSFWFTEKGLQRFADAIDEINRCMSETGWEVRCTVLWVHEMNYLYQDDYQIALGPEFVDRDSFVSFSHAADLMDFYTSTGQTKTEYFSEDCDFSG